MLLTRDRPRVSAAAATAVLALLVSGCGGSSGSAGSEPAGPESTGADVGGGAAADVSTCRSEATPADRPVGEAFPSDWPFPPESTVFGVEDRGSGGTIVTAVSSADFETVLDHMNTEVVQSGFEIESGETEERDAEAEWAGNGFRGRWAIRMSAQCPGETVVQVLAAPAG